MHNTLIKVPSDQQISSFTALSVISNDLWHSRLGHSSSDVMKHCDIVHVHNNKDACHIYPLARQQRVVFPLRSIKSNHCFALVHIDIWGPYRVPSFTGTNYFLIIVDDFTRCTWTFLLKN